MTLTTGRDFTWMSRHSHVEGHRREVSAPFCLKNAQTTYAIACDGKHLVAVTLLDKEEPPFEFDKVDTNHVIKMIEGSDQTQWGISPKALMDWVKCGNCNNVDIIKTCTNCKGKRTQNCIDCGGKGTERCECKGCGDVHTTDCSRCCGKKIEDCSICKGRGTIDCCCREEVDVAAIVGPEKNIWLDRRFIRKTLANLPLVWGKRILVSVKGPDDFVRFDAPGWTLVVAPVHDPNKYNSGELKLEKLEVLDAMAQL